MKLKSDVVFFEEDSLSKGRLAIFCMHSRDAFGWEILQVKRIGGKKVKMILERLRSTMALSRRGDDYI